MNISKPLTESTSLQERDLSEAIKPLITINTYREVMERSMSMNWLVLFLIPADSTAMYYGMPASGKSLLVLELAFCIASGIDWYGRACQQGSVVYISSEGHGGIKRRLKAIEEKYGIDNLDCPLHTIAHQVDIKDRAMMSELGEQLSAMENVKLVIFDTLHRNFSGDENSARDWGIAQANCDRLRDALNGASILIVHHTGKDTDKSYRGSAAILGSVDVSAKVSKKADAISLVHEKMKDAPEPELLRFKMKQVKLGEGEDEVSAVYLVSDTSVPRLLTGMKVDTKGPTMHEQNKLIIINAVRSLFTSDCDNGAGVNTLSLNKKDLKTECESKLVVEADSPESKRKAFDRAFKELVEIQDLVINDDGYICIPDINDHERKDGQTTSP